MEIKDFIKCTIQELEGATLEKLKGKLVGEYLTFSFLDETQITKDTLSEKLSDYFEKIEIKTGDKFPKVLAKYVSNWDDVVKQYLPKEPSAKKGEQVPPLPRSLKYYKHAVDIKGSRNLTMKQLSDYSRIMMCLYMQTIKADMKTVETFEFATESLDLDKIISALKAEKAGIVLAIGKKNMFDLEELYCTDTATFIISMIMFCHIKNWEEKGED